MVRNKAGKGKRSNQSDYIGAPYNFIPIAENTYEYDKKQRPNHNDMTRPIVGVSQLYY
mgnify:CR=1 FL=1